MFGFARFVSSFQRGAIHTAFTFIESLTYHIPPGRCFSACGANRCKICHRKLREGLEIHISDTCNVVFAMSKCIRVIGSLVVSYSIIEFILGYARIFLDLALR